MSHTLVEKGMLHDRASLQNHRVEIKNEWSYTSTPHVHLYGVDMDKFSSVLVWFVCCYLYIAL
jgi:hypothetical protein